MRNLRCRRFPFVLVLLSAVLISGSSAGQEQFDSLKFDIRAVDSSADPCEDFYEYACGGWLQRNPIPADRSYWSVAHQMRDLNQRRVTAILERAAEPRPDRPPIEQKVGDYYAACMDDAGIEAKGLGPIETELKRIDAIKDREDLAEAVARLHQLGSDALFWIIPDQRLEDASKVIAYLDQSGLNLPEPGYYTSDEAEMVKARAGYRAHLQRVFELLGQDATRAGVSAEEILKMEVALGRASLTPLERRDRQAWYHEMTFADLRRLAPAFAWQRYFATIGLQPAGKLNVAVIPYMKAVNQLVDKTPMPAWKNYLRWNLVRLATPVLPRRFRRAGFDFYGRTLRGVEQERSRAEQCGELTSNDLGEAVGQLYVQQYFPASSKQRVLALVDRLREAMRKDMQEMPWMSPPTRKEALRKLDMLRVMIGYPDGWRDYGALRVQRGDALSNAIRSREFEFARQLAKIGRPPAREEFYELPQSVSGYHDNPLNVVVFTAGILQPPFFDPQMDDAVTFGLTGAVIGHEFTHAFDDKGHLFDGAGNMRNWWTPRDAESYNQRAACFVRQYSSYAAVGDIKVNGELTLGENIADNGGLQLAWQAFEAQPKSGASVDGFTPEQRFFLGWAQWRCANATEKTAGVLARTDPHAPGRWRVNGVVSNMPGFRQAYQCKAGQPMVNPEPCRIW